MTQHTRAQERKAAFARAYADPSSPTAGNATRSYMVVNPKASEVSAGRAAVRYMSDPFVQREIAKYHQAVQTVTAMTAADYVRECLEREETFIALAKQDVKGAAQAAAKYREMAGKAAGLFVTQVKDVTPPGQGRRAERLSAAELIEAARMLQELERPNPLPQLAAPERAAPEPVDADYTIEERDERGGGGGAW